MKREVSKFSSYHGKDVNIFKFWNLFLWEHCLKCKKEFVRESGWRHCLIGYNVLERIVCKECCPTEESVAEYFKSQDDAAYKNRPRPSPPPMKPWKNKNG